MRSQRLVDDKASLSGGCCCCLAWRAYLGGVADGQQVLGPRDARLGLPLDAALEAKLLAGLQLDGGRQRLREGGLRHHRVRRVLLQGLDEHLLERVLPRLL